MDGLHQTCESLMSSLRRLAEVGISAHQFVELDALRRELRPSFGGRDAAAAGGPGGEAGRLARRARRR
ncbi:hypothetical protein [Nocardioides sp. TF02-7]|uniref:hypothetical protein n=1 Tax=Nocardioides sp. TF02-7 TaxID=2917724 RepID=UPI001F053453|nr:hypothetical protein [Nocardioides sp. TF02-7]UMG92382.1 hypothetical protein MF408_21255 [Nocardioides sp. TF02-7]